MQYQHGIIGGGCAGLQMLNALLLNAVTQNDRIIIFEPDLQIPDKSWCFWAKHAHVYENLIENRWNELIFRSNDHPVKQKIAPYQYQYISSQKFYEYHHQLIHQHKNVHLVRQKVTGIKFSNNLFEIETDEGKTWIKNAYDSRPNLKTAHKPILWQHFLGWQVETNQAVFNMDAATVMDFYKNDGGFVYLLPFDERKALIEFTYFSDQLFPAEHYRLQLKNFISERFPGVEYQLNYEECGKIPMSSDKFTGVGHAGEWLIGTVGGMTKATTGYTFARTMRDCEHIAAAVANGQPAFTNRGTKGRFLFYDRLLLGILKRRPAMLKNIMSQLFNRQPFQRILSFLDESSSITQELKIFGSLPWKPFLQQLFVRRKNNDRK